MSKVNNNIQQFLASLIQNDYKNALKYGTTLIMDGFNDDFWICCFNIMVEYTHIFLPNGPVFLHEKYTEFVTIQKQFLKINKKIKLKHVHNDIIVPVIDKLSKNYKQHISLYIQPEYNCKTKTNTKCVRELFIQLNTLLNKMVCEKQKNEQKIIKHSHIVKVQTVIGKLFSIDCDSVNNVHEIYKINIFTHTHSQIHEKIIHNVWNIILNHAKQLNPQTHKNIRCLAKLYHTRLLHKLESHSFIILNALFYFIYAYNYEIVPPKLIKNTVNDCNNNTDPNTANNTATNSTVRNTPTNNSAINNTDFEYIQSKSPHESINGGNDYNNDEEYNDNNHEQHNNNKNNHGQHNHHHDTKNDKIDYEKQLSKILNKPCNSTVQAILSEIDEDIKHDPFYMVRVYKLLQIPFDTIYGSDDTNNHRNNEINKQLQQKIVRQSMYDFSNLYASDNVRDLTDISENCNNNDPNDYKIIYNKSGIFNDNKSSQFQIIKME